MARKPRRKLMPNTKGPQIQVKDKRNAFIVNTRTNVYDAKDRYEETEAGSRAERQALNEMKAVAELNPRINVKERHDRVQLYNRDAKYFNHQESGILSKPKGSAYSKGDYTGAVRAPHPTVFRRFGGNTRERVYPFDKQGTKLTGVLDNHYDPKVLSPPGRQNAAHGLLPGGATTLQAGSPAVLRGIKSLQAGSHHWLFS